MSDFYYCYSKKVVIKSTYLSTKNFTIKYLTDISRLSGQQNIKVWIFTLEFRFLLLYIMQNLITKLGDKLNC